VPSYRQVIDWSNPDKSLVMHTTGQSGQVFNRHYDDMIISWLNVDFHAMLFKRDEVESDSHSLLVLKPYR